MSEILSEQTDRNDETFPSVLTQTKNQVIIQNAYKNIKKVVLYFCLRVVEYELY
jgi:hypothetical protein